MLISLLNGLPMTDVTPTPLTNKTKKTMKKVFSMKGALHASADALLFVQLFARACNA